MNALRGHRAVAFLDLEGTQFTHEMIELGAVLAILDPNGNVKRTLPPFRTYVKAQGQVGKIVKKLTGITDRTLAEKGVPFNEAQRLFRKYMGRYWGKAIFCTFGTHDLRIIQQTTVRSKECDHESHAGKKMFERHKRIPIEDAMAAGDMCPVHGDSRVEFYCTKCKVPLCVTCKVTGSHSKGDAASHKLIPIKDAYDMAVAAASEADGVVAERERMIDEQLKKVCQKLEGVVANEKDVEDEVMRIAHTVIENAKMLAGERALLLRSMRTELERKKDELKGVCEMLECHRAHSEQVLFVQAFDRYRVIVKGMKDNDGDIQREIDVDGDLFVHGHLDVSYNAKRGSPGKRIRKASMGEEEDARESRRITTPSPEKRRFPVEYTKLTDIAERKKRRHEGDLPFQPFHGSRIVPSSKASTLYLCFPFREVPETRLLFSTERDGRSISKMHELIDGMGITTILVKTGSYVFGGFAAAKWTNNGKPFGEKSSSFLFSLTHNAFIPYRPRVSDACHLLATPDSLTFGRYDFKLADDFDDCSAIIENSYGVGFERGGSDATTFMAGAPTFSADLVEVWGFFTLEKL